MKNSEKLSKIGQSLINNIQTVLTAPAVAYVTISKMNKIPKGKKKEFLTNVSKEYNGFLKESLKNTKDSLLLK